MMTDAQEEFIGALRRRLHLNERQLENHVLRFFGCGLMEMDKRSASALIDELLRWAEGGGIPAEIQREAGQLDMPGMVTP